MSAAQHRAMATTLCRAAAPVPRARAPTRQPSPEEAVAKGGVGASAVVSAPARRRVLLAGAASLLGLSPIERAARDARAADVSSFVSLDAIVAKAGRCRMVPGGPWIHRATATHAGSA